MFDRLCRFFIVRPGQDAKLIVFFSLKINKKEYKKIKKKE